MRKYGFLSVVPILLLLTSVVAASDLDSYYLARFRAVYGGGEASATAASLKSAKVSIPPVERCMTPLHHGLKRDWKLLARETQETLAKYVAAPVLQGEASHASAGGHFMIHYATSGVDAPPLADADANGVPDWVETVAATFEQVYGTEVGSMGYRVAPAGSDGRYHVYLQELSDKRFFGLTESNGPAAPGSTSFTSYIVIDDDFSESLYAPYLVETGLRVTAAHEYHHAIQFGYNFYFDPWYAEATATWMEDEVYDDINQLYTYLPAYFQNSTLALNAETNVSNGGGYGRWILNRFLAEKYSNDVVRSFWENLATIPAPASGADPNAVIPMTPVMGNVIAGSYGGDFNADFLAYAKRIYTRAWSSHAAEIGQIHSAVPVAAYGSYPVNGSTIPTPAVKLDPYSFAFYRLTPASAAPFELKLTIALSQGVSAVAFKKTTTGITEYPLDPATSTITVPDFNSLATTEVILLFCNNSPLASQTGAFTSDGSTPPQGSTASVASSGGGGCFIATAAYGSYLHPKVMVLRHFRDRFLLTNAPGRAFVDLYYSVSPPMARFIARHETLRALCRIALTPVIFFVEYPWLVPIFFAAGFTLLAGRNREDRHPACHGGAAANAGETPTLR